MHSNFTKHVNYDIHSFSHLDVNNHQDTYWAVSLLKIESSALRFVLFCTIENDFFRKIIDYIDRRANAIK